MKRNPFECGKCDVGARLKVEIRIPDEVKPFCDPIRSSNYRGMITVIITLIMVSTGTRTLLQILKHRIVGQNVRFKWNNAMLKNSGNIVSEQNVRACHLISKSMDLVPVGI